ncbi:MAG: D-2-hydroxyacid dehydrogenase [Acetobacteraceae bacterium]|nr:D-2-hydroxyacid dehydrogenase [Acetobacteraceae bacterium]
MRIHLQNPDNDPLFDFSFNQWQAAAQRAGMLGQGHDISIGRSHADCTEALKTAEILFGDTGVIRAQIPLQAPHLRIIQATMAGVDGLMPLDWLPAGVQFWSNRGVHAAKAGEFAIMAILMLANRMPVFATNQRERRWDKHYGSVLAGRRLTVIGLGALGASGAQHARNFGMHITGVRSSATPHKACDIVITEADLDHVLPDTEFLLIATPSTPATRNMLARQRLAALPKGANVINIGRGALLDQDALCDLLDTGHLGGAILDVFTPEPVPANHRIWTTKNLIMSPHTCADDPRTYNAFTIDLFFKNLRTLNAGQIPPTKVDPIRGY